MKLNPLGDRVVALKSQPLEKTKSGILLGSAQETPAFFVVESVGPEVKNIKPGDKIIVKDYSFTEVKIDQTDYIITKAEDILATL